MGLQFHEARNRDRSLARRDERFNLHGNAALYLIADRNRLYTCARLIAKYRGVGGEEEREEEGGEGEYDAPSRDALYNIRGVRSRVSSRGPITF